MKSEKIVIWGAGWVYAEMLPFLKELERNGEIEIKAVINNKPHSQKELDGYPMIYADDLKRYHYDKILIAADSPVYESIVADLKNMQFVIQVYEKISDYIKKSRILLMDSFYDFSLKEQLDLFGRWGL